jgi:hypothetical protein
LKARTPGEVDLKIERVVTLVSKGDFPEGKDWIASRQQLHTAIKAIDHPAGTGKFCIYPESGKKRGEGNGVVPIKAGLMLQLQQMGWKLEQNIDIATLRKPGPIDAVLETAHGLFAVEWETGNISSSHRSVNKMALGIMKGVLIGGVLILPTRKLAAFLTDRIGNFEELEPYFGLWQAVAGHVDAGLLEIVAVHHDMISYDVPRIPKGTDGRALS